MVAVLLILMFGDTFSGGGGGGGSSGGGTLEEALALAEVACIVKPRLGKDVVQHGPLPWVSQHSGLVGGATMYDAVVEHNGTAGLRMYSRVRVSSMIDDRYQQK